MSDKRQKNRLVLAFTEEGRSEAPRTSQEGTESLTAECESERPAGHEQLVEEVCERKNWQAYQRIKANKGSPGIDGMSIGDLAGYLMPIQTGQALFGRNCANPTRLVDIYRKAIPRNEDSGEFTGETAGTYRGVLGAATGRFGDSFRLAASD
jgi:hypothetical protein